MKHQWELFAEDVRDCGKMTGSLARERGWRTQTIRAAIGRGVVRSESRGSAVSPYTVYLPGRKS